MVLCSWCKRPPDSPGVNAAGNRCPCTCHGERPEWMFKQSENKENKS